MDSKDKELLIKLLDSKEFDTQNELIENFYELHGITLAQSSVSRFLRESYIKYPRKSFGKRVYIPKAQIEEERNNREFQELIEFSNAKIKDDLISDYLLINYQKNEYKDLLIKYIKIISPETVIINTESNSLFLISFTENGLKKIRDMFLTGKE